MRNYGRSLASLQWSEETLLKGNSVLMPVLTKGRADYLYFQAKRRFHKWLKYANRNSRIMEFRNGAILQITTTDELARKNRGTVRIMGTNADRFVREEGKETPFLVIDEVNKGPNDL